MGKYIILSIIILSLMFIVGIIYYNNCKKNEDFQYECRKKSLKGPKGNPGVCNNSDLLGNILSTTQFVNSNSGLYNLQNPGLQYYFAITPNYNQELEISNIQFWISVASSEDREFSFGFFTRLSGVLAIDFTDTVPGDGGDGGGSQNKFVPILNRAFKGTFKADEKGFVNYQLFDVDGSNDGNPQTIKITKQNIINSLTSQNNIEFTDNKFNDGNGKFFGDPVVYLGVKIKTPTNISSNNTEFDKFLNSDKWPKLFCNKNAAADEEGTNGIGEVSWSVRGDAGRFNSNENINVSAAIYAKSPTETNDILLPVINVT